MRRETSPQEHASGKLRLKLENCNPKLAKPAHPLPWAELLARGPPSPGPPGEEEELLPTYLLC
jgi:hypothetical protein